MCDIAIRLVCCVHVNRFENLAYGLASEDKPNRVIVALALWEDSVLECATILPRTGIALHC